MKSVLAIDVGGSGARLALSNSSGRTLFNRPGGGEQRDARQRLIHLLRWAIESSIETPDVVSAGLTGFNGIIPDLSEIVGTAQSFGIGEVVVADDALTNAYGATGGSPGVVAAVGTGMVALAIAPDGRTARVDGASQFLGDRGSGWWIGRQGLIAAFSSAESRQGGSAMLLAAAIHQYGDIYTLPAKIRRSSTPFAEIAVFTEAVAHAAKAGDREAVRIFHEAGSHIGTAVHAAASQTGQSQSIPLTLMGGVSKSLDLLLPGVTDALARMGSTVTLKAPQGDALIGADLIARSSSLHSSLLRRWRDLSAESG